MKKVYFLLVLLSIALGCKKNDPASSTKEITKTNENYHPNVDSSRFSIVIHGGAGTILKAHMTPELEAAYRQKLEEAIRTGHSILKGGGSSLDAVQKAINILEDAPLFNAGKGAVFTSEGTNEHDASIMDGRTLNAGASAGTSSVKNPINLARAIMEASPHVMLSGKGAEQFAKEQGLELVDPSYFYTENRFKSLQKIIENEQSELDQNKKISNNDRYSHDSKFGTVGCVALDRHGNLASGTSTGGMTNKRWGRIGDSPIIGAGTYSNNNTCAVSSTGWGEYFIRGVVAYDISALMEYKGLTLAEAAREVVQNKLNAMGGSGGIIAIDRQGHMVMEFNTPGMFRASMNDKEELYIGIYEE